MRREEGGVVFGFWEGGAILVVWFLRGGKVLVVSLGGNGGILMSKRTASRPNGPREIEKI